MRDESLGGTAPLQGFVEANFKQLFIRWILINLLGTGGGLNGLYSTEGWIAGLIWMVILAPLTVWVNCGLWSAVKHVILRHSWTVPPVDPIDLHDLFQARAYQLEFFLLAVPANIMILWTEGLLFIPIGIPVHPNLVIGGIMATLANAVCNWFFPLWEPAVAG